MGAGMADHPHTIDRWDDATGQNLWSSSWPKDKTTLRKSDAGH